MNRLQTGYNPPDPRWPMPQSLLDNLAAAQSCERELPVNPWLEKRPASGAVASVREGRLKSA